MCVHVCDTQMHSPVFLKCKVLGGLLGRFYIRCRGEAAQAFGGAVRIKFLLCKEEHEFHHWPCSHMQMGSLGSGPCCASVVPTRAGQMLLRLR